MRLTQEVCQDHDIYDCNCAKPGMELIYPQTALLKSIRIDTKKTSLMPSKELISFIVVSKLTLQRYNDFHYYYFYCTTDLYIINVSIGFNNNKTGPLVFFEIHHRVCAYYILSPIPYYHHQSRNSNLPLLLIPSCLIWDCPLFVINAGRASRNSSNAFPPLFCVIPFPFSTMYWVCCQSREFFLAAVVVIVVSSIVTASTIIVTKRK